MLKHLTQDDIIYFVVTDRFYGREKRQAEPSDTTIHGGTLDGIIEKLDYLIELGVTTVWVTPVYENIEGFGPRNLTITTGHSASTAWTVACWTGPICPLQPTYPLSEPSWTRAKARA